MTDDIEITASPIPMGNDVWAQEALDGLIGQTPALTVGFDYSANLGRVTITKAEQTDAGLVLGFKMPPDTARRFNDRYAQPDPRTEEPLAVEYSIGFTRQPPVEPVQRGPIRLFEVATGWEGTFFPKPAIRKDPES